MSFKFAQVVFSTAFFLIISSYSLHAQNNSAPNEELVLVESKCSHFTFKTYPDGTMAGYFLFSGKYSLKNLHRIQQLFTDLNLVADVSVMEKDENKTEHVIFIRVTEVVSIEEWIPQKLNENLSDYLY